MHGTPANRVILSQLHTERASLPVPGVYFVSPTLANIRRIAEDMHNGVYESYYLNFVESLPRDLLEELASEVANDETADLVKQVRIGWLRIIHCRLNRRVQLVDTYLSFISPSPSLFSLLPPVAAPSTPTAASQPGPSTAELQSSYAILNSPSTSEQQVEEETERIAKGLFSVVATMGLFVNTLHLLENSRSCRQCSLHSVS